MQVRDLKKKKLPDAPGVYFFLGANKKILYIGKATSLRDRVKSYFSRDLVAARGHVISKMVLEARDISVEKTDSVLEALILEANLIKKYRPKYNTREKDDKSFNYVVITKEDWPRVVLVRGKDLAEMYQPRSRKYLFGPFPSGYIFKEAMKLVQKIFPYYDTTKPLMEMTSKSQAGKVSFNRSIGLYPGVDITKTEYGRTIQHIKLFFEGKKSMLLRKLEREMKNHASKQEFEKANRLKRAIFGLKHIQDVSLLRRDVRELSAAHSYRIEAYDVAHLGGKASVGVMVVVQDGEAEKSEYRKFKIQAATEGSDTGALEEVLVRRLKHDEWLLPQLVVVDGGKSQINVAKRVLKEFGYQIPVASVVKDEHHRPRQVLGEKASKKSSDAILLANGEAHRFAIKYHRNLRQKSLT